MESSFLNTGAKIFTRKGMIRRRQPELAIPTTHRWCVRRTSEPGVVSVRVRCLKCDGGREVERRGHYDAIEDDEEWKEMGKWALEKCMGELGMVEMLECLEKEAIMGEVFGKDPTDYDRRARIFDKSSKVFQALRDEEEQHHPPA